MVNRQATISIVVPVYKVKREYLDECLGSLLNQTYRDIQIVLVDDGSPDDCGKWCDEYAARDARVLAVHHERNKGLPTARNTGTANADAKWIMYVDSDDWLDLDCCEKLMGYVEKWDREPDMIIFTGYRNYFDSEEKSTAVFENEKWFVGKDEIKDLQIRSLTFTNNSYPDGAMNLDGAWCRLISKEYIDRTNLGFVNIPYREDGLYFLHSTEKADSIVYISDPFYHYRSTAGGMVESYRPKADAEQLMYLTEVWKFIESAGKDSDFIKAAYYGVQLSMHACIYQKFFSPQNKESLFKRNRACAAYFKNEPYASAIKNIEIKKLKKNFALCAVLVKLHLYPLIPFIRNIKNKLKGTKSY